MENDYTSGFIAGQNSNRNNYGYGDGMFGGCGGGWFIWIVLIFFIFGGGMWNNNRNDDGFLSATMQRGFDNGTVVSKLDGITNGLCDGNYAQNTTLLTGFGNTNMAIKDAQYSARECCCETNRNIDATRYEAQKNTCDITTAIHAEGEATRALIQANTVQELRDRLEAKDRELLTANFNLSQQAQTYSLVNEIRPVSKPAYITCSPYAANGTGSCLGCGC